MPANIDHPCFVQPQDKDALVWRYMDFTKFISLLETDTLFFAQADCFEDPFEGSVPKGNLIHRNQIYSEIPEDQRENAIAQIIGHRKKMRSHTYVNCWHMSEYESAAMWKLYASTSEAVAICTKYSTLMDSLENDVLLGQVNYIDYENSTIPENNSLWPFMFKRMSFAHEKEVRAVTQDLSQSLSVNGGVAKTIVPEKLIRTVFVAPDAPSWYFNLVTQVVSRYGLSAKVIQSSLADQPVY